MFGSMMTLTNAFFNQAQYLENNPDVAIAVDNNVLPNACDHFSNMVISEDRNDGSFIGAFNNALYLADNLDVAAAVNARKFFNSYQHHLDFGEVEGAAAFNTVRTQINPNVRLSLTFKLTSDAPGVVEGNTVHASRATTGVAPGTSLAYPISGTELTAADVIDGSLTVDTSGSTVVPLTLTADALARDEPVTATLHNGDASVDVSMNAINRSSGTDLHAYSQCGCFSGAPGEAAKRIGVAVPHWTCGEAGYFCRSMPLAA